MKQQNKQIDWREIELGDRDYFEVKKGTSITKSTITPGKIPVIAGGQQPAYYHDTSNRQGGTITVSGSGAYAGFVNYFEKPIFASDCSTIQKKTNKILIKYVYLFLKGYQRRIYSLQKGIAQPHVYPKDIMQIKISIPFSNGEPHLEEQERIISILEKAEKQKERSKKAEQLLEEYLKSIFNEMFEKEKRNWKNSTIGECSTSIINGLYVPREKYSVKGTAEMVHMSDAFYGTVIGGGLKKVLISEKEIKKYLLTSEDLIIARRSLNYEGAAKPCRILEYSKPLVFESSLIRITPDKKLLNPVYLYYYLSSPRIRKEEIEKFVTGAIIYGINQSALRKILLFLPPLTLQQNFASIVEQVEKMKEIVRKNQQKSEELFNSLMQKAFRGEL